MTSMASRSSRYGANTSCSGFEQHHVHRVAAGVEAAREAQVSRLAGRACHARAVLGSSDRRRMRPPRAPRPGSKRPARARRLTVRHDLDLGAHQLADAFCASCSSAMNPMSTQAIVSGRAHRREEHLVGVRVRTPGSVGCSRPSPRIGEERGERAVGVRGERRRRRQHPAAGVQHHYQVRADALRVVVGRRENRGYVAARDRLAEAEVSRQHRDAVGQLRRRESSPAALASVRAGAQLLRRNAPPPCAACWPALRPASQFG